MALALGLLDVARLFRPIPEILLDLPSAIASLVAAWMLLRRRSCAFVTTSVCGGVIVADALVSLVLIGPLLWQVLTRSLDESPASAREALAIVIPWMLLYGFQLVFWPYAVSRVMRDQRAAGIPEAYTRHTRATVIGGFFICGWISLVVQLVAKVVVFSLV